ncbi:MULTISPECIES: peptide ABC transporter substrate-binding protein [Streptomyces]|jgi:peptide/nickel transport system substrate-binding protein|uniref:Peptide ABC transporter substrate-binding protein n=2 Tax=Streptomyces griseoaurantiacus TaxID=68213 RepID=A0A7W2DVX1_9ACTN|nr:MULTISPECIES: peptide ABC transporter substrate-binding protein [Streptomyces]MBA5224030.1 peptide ABC transporter substrate-binding protein [Streptomyces griseoaurantiacus]MCF0086212.1 Oligopeptide-binding protein OppA [Streptomyces sp. MH192]MCF0098589.1 Oligopeptide-binding protein OppA [Streptomyces sp. MH191]MDX3361906.1 peptide ABC transporter substrate-binding protein [Streptomyces sp. ME02-6978.2a]WTI30645.1 peptide ABC transporter substrate-binding protein [Streptomyces jietaisiens
MFPARTASGRRWALVAGAAVLSGALLTGCSGGGDSSSGGHSSDSINYALPANFTPNWILPIGTAAHLNTNNASISQALWEPLIAYDGSTGEVGWNKDNSLATAADFAKDNKSVTLTLGNRHWSDGKPITSRDVEFWFNLVKANKADWASYSPGKAPDNWTSFKTVDDTHFTLTFDKAYNRQWMLANELSMIRTMPQHVWDKTSDSGTVSDQDRTAAGAKKVWTYLNKAAKNISGYASDPLWKTVSGPYTLKSFSTAGKVQLTANAKYDGGGKAHIKDVNLLPFTTTDAEANALRAGTVDYGYINATDLGQKASFTSRGYRVEPWAGWAITYMPYNFNNPSMGAVFKQLYARQAIQRSVDQKSLSKVIFNGTAVPTYGPIPQGQTSDFVSPVQKNNPYPFDTAEARKLLTSHGWTEQGGTMVCTDAGSGDDQCGEGVAKGTKFRMQVLSQSGSAVTDNMMSALQSSFAKTGIKFDIKTAPVNSVLSQSGQCKPGDSHCKWQLSFFGTAGSWYFPAYPSGDSLFQTGGGSNFGSYSNPAVDKLISRTTTSDSTEAVQEYSAALAKDLPVIWLPEPDYQVSVVKKGLGGFAQDSLANFHPAMWQWTGK